MSQRSKTLTEESLYIRFHVSKLHFDMSKKVGKDSKKCGSFTEIRLILVEGEDKLIPDRNVCVEGVQIH